MGIGNDDGQGHRKYAFITIKLPNMTYEYIGGS